MRSDPRCFLSTCGGNRVPHTARLKYAAKTEIPDPQTFFDVPPVYKLKDDAGYFPRDKYYLHVYNVDSRPLGTTNDRPLLTEEKTADVLAHSCHDLTGFKCAIIGNPSSSLVTRDGANKTQNPDKHVLRLNDVILGVNPEHMVIWYNPSTRKVMIEGINGITVVYSVTLFSNVVESTRYQLSVKPPKTSQVMITAIDGPKGVTSDKCIFAVHTGLRRNIYFIEGPHCGDDLRHRTSYLAQRSRPFQDTAPCSRKDRDRPRDSDQILGDEKDKLPARERGRYRNRDRGEYSNRNRHRDQDMDRDRPKFKQYNPGDRERDVNDMRDARSQRGEYEEEHRNHKSERERGMIPERSRSIGRKN